MAVSKADLFKVLLTRREAYLLYLAKEEDDETLLPKPLTAQEEVLYDYCINSSASTATDAAEAAEAAADLAKDWATKTSAAVADGEYSAKYYATSASNSAALASDWAVKMDGMVQEGGVDVDYSAKYYADQAHPAEETEPASEEES